MKYFFNFSFHLAKKYNLWERLFLRNSCQIIERLLQKMKGNILFYAIEIIYRTSWNRDLLNIVCLLASSLLKRRKRFLHHIVKIKLFLVSSHSPNVRKSSGYTSHTPMSSAQPNIHQLQGHVLYLVWPPSHNVL